MSKDGASPEGRTPAESVGSILGAISEAKKEFEIDGQIKAEGGKNFLNFLETAKVFGRLDAATKALKIQISEFKSGPDGKFDFRGFEGKYPEIRLIGTYLAQAKKEIRTWGEVHDSPVTLENRLNKLYPKIEKELTDLEVRLGLREAEPEPSPEKRRRGRP